MIRPTTFAQAMDRIDELEADKDQLRRDLGLLQRDGDAGQLQRLYGMTQTEARIVLALRARSPRLVSKFGLMDVLYADRPNDEPEPKIIDVFVSKIRKKLPDPSWIHTIWGQGYALTESGGAAIDDLLGVAGKVAA
jgi:DNA-binding response OmpR family regulator